MQKLYKTPSQDQINEAIARARIARAEAFTGSIRRLFGLAR